MGTRALTVILDAPDDGGHEIVVLYRHMDGGPRWHGAALKEFLAGIELVHGFSQGDNRRIANGMGCLAAQIVAHFKTDPGGFYLYPAGTRGGDEQYIYTVYQIGETVLSSARKPPAIGLKVETTEGRVLFDGPVAEFDPDAAERRAEGKPRKSRTRVQTVSMLP
jgi:hypothetical protein